MNSIFTLKPYYKRRKINLRKAHLKNIFRWLYVGKLRYLKRLYSYLKLKQRFKRIKSINELASITAITRPNKLSLKTKNEFFKFK